MKQQISVECFRRNRHGFVMTSAGKTSHRSSSEHRSRVQTFNAVHRHATEICRIRGRLNGSTKVLMSASRSNPEAPQNSAFRSYLISKEHKFGLRVKNTGGLSRRVLAFLCSVYERKIALPDQTGISMTPTLTALVVLGGRCPPPMMRR